MKGLRGPGAWALTQAQIDYSHGFIKRGLHGALLSRLGLHHAHALGIVFFIELGAMFFLLGALTQQARSEDRFGSLAPVTVFASSFAITFLTHVVGYTDIPLTALLVLLLLLRDPKVRFVAGLLLVPLALLVHENFLLLYLPVLLFSFVLDASQAEQGRRRGLYMRAAALGLLALAITLAFSVRGSLKPAEVGRFEAEIKTRVDFGLRDDFFNVLSRPLSGSFAEAWDGFSYPDWYVADLVSFANLLLPTLLLLHIMRVMVRSTWRGDAKARRWMWIAATAAILAPLLMFFLGVDGGRWNTAAATVVYLEMLLLCRTLPAGGVVLSTRVRNAVVLVLAVNMASGMGLFDGESVHPFPFLPAVSSDYR